MIADLQANNVADDDIIDRNLLPPSESHHIDLYIVAELRQFVKLPILSEIAYGRERNDNEHSKEDASTVVPTFFESMLLDSEAERKRCAAQKDENGDIFESFQYEMNEAFRTWLWVSVGAEYVASA